MAIFNGFYLLLRGISMMKFTQSISDGSFDFLIKRVWWLDFNCQVSPCMDLPPLYEIPSYDIHSWMWQRFIFECPHRSPAEEKVTSAGGVEGEGNLLVRIMKKKGLGPKPEAQPMRYGACVIQSICIFIEMEVFVIIWSYYLGSCHLFWVNLLWQLIRS